MFILSGIAVDTEKTEETTLAPSQVKLLYLERTIKDIGKVKAMGCQTSDGFVVMKGSQISTKDADSIPKTVKEKREKANITGGILQEDILLSSPSYAASFVIGQSCNGLTSWKTKVGQTLKALEAADI